MEELGFSSADQGCRCIVGVLELERKVMTIGENTKYDLGGVSFGSCGLGGQTLEKGAQEALQVFRGVWMWHWGLGLGVVMVGLDDPEGLLQL